MIASRSKQDGKGLVWRRKRKRENFLPGLVVLVVVTVVVMLVLTRADRPSVFDGEKGELLPAAAARSFVLM